MSVHCPHAMVHTALRFCSKRFKRLMQEVTCCSQIFSSVLLHPAAGSVGLVSATTNIASIDSLVSVPHDSLLPA
jgi:hypothetical protein